MKKIATLFMIMLLVSCSTKDVAKELKSKKSATDPRFNQSIPNKEIIVKVNGAVCGFCSYGVRKKISTLPFVDKSKYENGILANSEEQSVTIAVLPYEKVDENEIRKLVIEAGYETLSIDYNYEK